jgi:hypothetical protein
VETTEVIEPEDQRWWRPARSAVALALLLVGLGVAAAAMLGLGAVALMALFDRALG